MGTNVFTYHTLMQYIFGFELSDLYYLLLFKHINSPMLITLINDRCKVNIVNSMMYNMYNILYYTMRVA